MRYKKIFTVLLICICIFIFITSFYILFIDFKEYKENNQDTEELIEDAIAINSITEEQSVDWNHLKSVNEDIVGWIEIENTNINYPILKDNNLFYLKHSYNKKYSSYGSIFTTNTNPFSDEETVIYGHNMKNGSMFSSLGKYLNEDFLYTHQNFKIYTPNGDYQATIFSAYSIGFDIESNNIKQLGFDERIAYYKKSSKHYIENIDTPDKIIKLSTCSYINAKTTPTDQRYYIIASIVPIK